MLRTIRSDQLVPGMYVHRLSGSWLDHPFWRSAFLADAQDVARIRASGLAGVVIDVSLGLDVAAVATGPTGVCGEASVDASMDPDAPTRSQAIEAPPAGFESEVRNARSLLDAGRAVVEAMFGEARLGRSVDTGAAAPLVEAICASVLRNPHALISVARLKSADDYTYLHSMAVAGLMAGLARQLGHSTEQVHAAAKGGLLHDMGKAVSPLHVLNKPGSLTEDEYAAMRRHPQDGHRLLVESGVADPEALDIALHHHERVDGTGYPHQLAGDAISLMARMAAVCDVYDAITSDRPYKRGWCPAESLRRMASWTGHFDPVVFQAFVRSLGIYPVGTLVRLQSQQLAVVMEQSPAALLKPVVRVFHCIRRNARVLMHDLDLSAAGSTDRILQPEAAGDWALRDLDRLWLP